VTDEGALAVDCRKIERGVDGIEVLFALGELIGKDVGECGDLNAGVFRERGSDRGTAASASEQAVAHARIGSVAECSLGFDEEESGGCGCALNKFASVHLRRVSVVALCGFGLGEDAL